MKNNVLIALLVVGLSLVALGLYWTMQPVQPKANTPTPAPTATTGSISVSASASTPVAVCVGQKVCTVMVSGRINYSGGDKDRWADADSNIDPAAYNSLAPGIPFGTLIGKIGEHGKWFQVGSHRSISNDGETVYLIVNDSRYDDNSGAYSVIVK